MEAVVGVGCLAGSLFTPYEHFLFPEDIKQLVSANFKVLQDKQCVQGFIKLSGAYPWLIFTLLLDQFHNL
jgi:hypothetical protein